MGPICLAVCPSSSVLGPTRSASGLTCLYRVLASTSSPIGPLSAWPCVRPFWVWPTFSASDHVPLNTMDHLMRLGSNGSDLSSVQSYNNFFWSDHIRFRSNFWSCPSWVPVGRSTCLALGRVYAQRWDRPSGPDLRCSSQRTSVV